MLRRWLMKYRVWHISTSIRRGPDRRRDQVLAYYQRRGWVTSYRFYGSNVDIHVSDRWRWGWTGPGLWAAAITKRWDE